jgi:RNase P/RNase MRP subunit p30
VKGKIESFKDVGGASERRNKKVLVLLDDYKFDVGAIKLIGEKKKMCFLIDLSRIIKSYRVKRAIEISKLRSFLRLCNKYGALYAFATFSDKEEEIRTPEELMHIAMLFDINKGQAKFALRMLGEYIN